MCVLATFTEKTIVAGLCYTESLYILVSLLQMPREKRR